MTIYPLTRPRPRCSRRILWCVIAITGVLTATARAQVGGIDPDPGDPGTGGKNTIQGRIFLPGGQRLDRRVKVKLRGLASSEQFQMSDDNGQFSFRRLQGGTYTLVVDAGKEFEVTTESVDIIEPARRRSELGMVIPVYITLTPRGNTSANARPGTISATANAIPDAAKDLYKQAMDSDKAGNRKKAIELLNKSLELYPDFVAALNQLGLQYMELGDWGKASDPLRKAIKLAPDAFQPRLNYGIVLIQVKNYKDAAAELAIATQRDSSSGIAQLYLGRAMVNLGKYELAQTALKRSISIGGDDVIEAHRYLAAVYIETQKAPLAADELEAYLKLAPKAKDADRIRSLIKDLRSQATSRHQ